MIVDKIGLPAVLEQCGEECCELGAASLKMARKLRGENPTPKSFEEIRLNLIDEIADVTLCMAILKYEAEITTDEITHAIMERKEQRWNDRIKEAEAESGETDELS